ncbi:MAG: RelA/SpoT domain-containing protein [Terracidiphilus sp.]
MIQIEAPLSLYIMERKHTNTSVNRAGDFISGRADGWLPLFISDKGQWEKQFDESFGIMAEWRSIHAVPLKAVSALLASEASTIDGSPIVSERLKRFRSIRSKLQRFPVNNLATMQDIAGCRAVVQAVSHAYKLRDQIIGRLQSQSDGPQIIDKWSKDYIADPKPDGYRSLHHVAKFYSADAALSHCNDLKVEIQIRSQMQHAWAMAVETASAVTNQALKSGEGQELWKRFFFLVAEIIAANEGMPSSLTNDFEHTGARREAAELAGRLRVLNLLSSMQHVLEDFSTFEGTGGRDLYLLVLDSQKREINYVGYKKEDFKQASNDYAEQEREHQNEEDVHVVLVSAESLEDLKSAYPSFFLDSTGFIALIRDQVFGS